MASFDGNDEEVCKGGKKAIMWLKQKNNHLREENGQLRSDLMELHKQIQNSNP